MSGSSIGVAADWLSLAAAPTFALMALLTGYWRTAGYILLCRSCISRLSAGMMPMYLLMAAFHSPSWLRLLNR